MTRREPPTSSPRHTRVGPKRVVFQWLTTLAIIGIPFIRVNGTSLLRLDVSSLTLHAFGQRFPITDLSLFLLLAIALTLLFLLVTLAFGRAWCGWACPQTSLVDLLEWLARRIGVKVAGGRMTANFGQRLVMQAACLVLALLVGANLVWYFVSPYAFFPLVFKGELHWAASLTWIIVSATVYLDLAFLRRLFCMEFCPYGRFQTVLIDPGTLVLHYHPDEAPRCIRCGACVRSCPTGVDIRRGYQVECINCGRCLDACREVMARRGEPGIIRYTFGLEGRGLPALFNLRMALVTIALVGVTTALVTAAVQRDDVSFKVARNAALLPRDVGRDKVANFFTAYLTNRTQASLAVRLTLPEGAVDLSLRGAVGPHPLAPGEKRRVDFAVIAGEESLAKPRPIDILIVSGRGEPLAETRIFLTGVLK